MPIEDNKFHENEIILAPMVKVGTLPMRLLALRYGADRVYSEELIDWKLLKTKRYVNSVLKTVDFVDPSDGNIIFRTCDEEKGKVTLQLGTADPERALAVGKMVQADIAAIDINMGCPKEFSVKGGMGAALLVKPQKAKEILQTLVDNLLIPVTCKIRILPTLKDTVELVKEFASTGIRAIAIHARTKDERPRHEPHLDIIKKLAEVIDIPIIANGGSREIQKFCDIDKFRNVCGVKSVMIARAAQYNVSIFRRKGLLPLDEVIKEYLKLCIDYDNSPSNTKYCVQSMLRDQQETPRGRQLLDSQTLEQICRIWHLDEYCHKKQVEYQEKGDFGRRQVIPGKVDDDDDTYNSNSKRIKLDEIFEKNIAFFRANYNSDKELPKSKLHLYAVKNNKYFPTYDTQRRDKLFRTILKFDGKQYASSYWEKNKKYAEQGAALVCVLALGLVTEEMLIQDGSILR